MPAAKSVSDILAAFSGGTLSSITPVLDTAANVDANFDALQAIASAGLLGTISLSNGGRPTIAVTPAQVTADAAVLSQIDTPYFLAQRTAASDAATATLADPFKAIAIVDTAANIAANLPAIETRYKTGYLGIVRMTDTGTPVFSLTAAQVAANADALSHITAPYSITLTDAGTPTITLPVWDTYTSIYTNVVARITTPFTLALGGVIRTGSVASIEVGVDRYTSSNTTGLPPDPIAPLGAATAALLPGGLQVLDYQSKLSNIIDSLEIAAEAGKLTSVTLRDGGPQILSLTPSELTNDALALSKFSPNVELSQIITAAQAAAPPSLATGFFDYTVQDSLANIMANIGAIGTLARTGLLGKLRFLESSPDITLTAAQLGQAAFALSFAFEISPTVTLTDPGTPTVTIGGDVLNVSNVRNNILNHVTGSYNLAVSGVIDSFLATTIVSENNKVLASLTSVHVTDFSGNIVTNLNALQTLATAGKLTAIDLVGGGVPILNISSATATADAFALSKITSPYALVGVIATPASLTSAAFLSSLSSLEAQTEGGTLGAVTLTDSGTPVLTTTAANLTTNLAAFGKIITPYTITLTDGGTPAMVLRPWQVTAGNLAVLGKISGAFSFSVSDTVSAFQGATLASSAVLADLTGQVSITDYSNNLSVNFPNNLPGLETLFLSGHLGSVTLFDGGARIPLTPAEATSNADVLNAITSPYSLSEVVTAAAAASTTIPSGKFSYLTVQDSEANVVANLASLEPLATSGKLTSILFTGTVTTISMSAAAFAANADALRLAGSFSIALTDAGTPTVTLQNWQVVANSAITTLLSRITTPYTLVVNGPIRANTAATLANGGSSIVSKIAANSLIIRDPPDSFQSSLPQLLTLATDGKIASIDTRTGGVTVFSLTPAAATTYAPVLSLINTPDLLAQVITVADLPSPVLAAGFTTFALHDTVANVLGALPQIEALAAAGKLARLQFTDTAPRIVTSAANIMSAADAWGVEDFNPYPVVLTDPGTPVITLPSYQLTYDMRNDILDTIAGPWSLQISGNASPGTLATIVEENNGVLAHLAGPVNVADYSFNVQPYLDQLEALTLAGKIGSITLIDGGTPTITLTTQQATADADAIGKIVSPFNLVTCFAAGTRIQTIDGQVAVEDLRPGDHVHAVLSGRAVPVLWIGHRYVDCSRHPQPRLVWPVRVSAGAFGPGQPGRDLWLSPDHAVYFDDILIPVKYLINGEALPSGLIQGSIVQIPIDEVTYYHIELPCHSVVLAEGLPTESYLDSGDRSNFTNGGGPVTLYPDFVSRIWEAAGCAPLIAAGPKLDAARRWVNSLAASMPHSAAAA